MSAERHRLFTWPSVRAHKGPEKCARLINGATCRGGSAICEQFRLPILMSVKRLSSVPPTD